MLKGERRERPAFVRGVPESRRMPISSADDQAHALGSVQFMILNPLCKFFASSALTAFIQNDTKTVRTGIEQKILHLFSMPLFHNNVFYPNRSFQSPEVVFQSRASPRQSGFTNSDDFPVHDRLLDEKRQEIHI